MKKIYCKDCKYLILKWWRWKCDHINSRIECGDWHGRFVHNLSPMEKNKDNDCGDFRKK